MAKEFLPSFPPLSLATCLSILDSNSFLCFVRKLIEHELGNSFSISFEIAFVARRSHASMSSSFDLLYCTFGLWKIGSQAVNKNKQNYG